MPRASHRRPYVALAVFLTPLALVQLTSVWAEINGPRHASAVSAANVATLTAAPTPAPLACPPEVERAGTHAAELRLQAWGMSPFPAPAKPAPQTIAKPAATIKVVFAPVIRSIMSSKRGKFAVIDGSVRGVGDPLPHSDWQVEDIDSAARTVTFRNAATNETVTLGVDGDEGR